MEYIDLTHPLKNKIFTYPEDPECLIKDISLSNSEYQLSKIESGLHVGTHVDAPYHYFKDGKKISDIQLSNLIGNADILERKYVFNDSQISFYNAKDQKITEKEIMIEDMRNIPDDFEKIIILKTGWFNKWHDKDYFINNTYLSKDLTRLFIENNINGIAIDSPSVDKYGKSTIHKMLLKNDIWIVENLTNMDKLSEDKYYSYFIPLNIQSEASFTRAFIENKY